MFGQFDLPPAAGPTSPPSLMPSVLPRSAASAAFTDKPPSSSSDENIPSFLLLRRRATFFAVTKTFALRRDFGFGRGTGTPGGNAQCRSIVTVCQ